MTSIKATTGTIKQKCKPACKPKCTVHGWTLTYWADGKQTERTFRDQPGKPGKKLAQDFALRLAVGKREGDVTFADKTKGIVRFTDYVAEWIARKPNEGTQATLKTTLKRIMPELGSKTLAQVAGDRELVQSIIDEAPPSYARKTRLVLVSPCNEALKAGRIPLHVPPGITRHPTKLADRMLSGDRYLGPIRPL